MANRFPLTLDPQAQQIREISVGDSLDLTGNTLSSDLIPLAGNTYSLGGLGFQWLDMHAQNIYGMLQTGSQPVIFEVGTISAGQWQGSVVDTQYGGTGGAIVPAAGGVVYSTASQLSVAPAGAGGQVLRSNGISAPSWTSSLNLTDLTISSSLDMLDRQSIRFYEGGGGPNYVALRAPLTLAGDYTLNLPASDGTSGQVLVTDGSGNLGWAGNAGSFIAEGDSEVRVSDPSSAPSGMISFKTDGVTRWEFITSGDLIPSTASVYDIGQPAQRVSNVYADSFIGTLLTASQTNITTLGTITGGTWQAGIIDPLYGGTGVANPSGRTITLGGSIVTSSAFQTSGNFGITLTATGATNVTLPTSGTLVSSSVTSLTSLQTVGTLLSLTVSGSANFQADTTIGSSPANTLTLNSRVGTDIVPSADNTKDLGAAGYRFAEVYGALAYINEVRLPDQGVVKFYEDDTQGSDYVGFQAGSNLTSTVVWTLPNGDGNAGTVLKTDGVGVLTFSNSTRDWLPEADNTYNLGSATNRWANVYTGDLHLKNDRGDWTLIEEEDALTIRNNKTGKVFNIMMTPREA